MAKPEAAYDRGDRELVDTTLGWRFVNPKMARAMHPYFDGRDGRERRRTMGGGSRPPGRVRSRVPAEGRRGHRGRPVRRPDRADHGSDRKGGEPVVRSPTSIPAPTRGNEALANLKPAFARTAVGRSRPATASGLNDGSTALLLARPRRPRRRTNPRPATSQPPRPVSTRPSWASGPCPRPARRSPRQAGIGARRSRSC